jgi:hypothetical protein
MNSSPRSVASRATEKFWGKSIQPRELSVVKPKSQKGDYLFYYPTLLADIVKTEGYRLIPARQDCTTWAILTNGNIGNFFVGLSCPIYTKNRSLYLALYFAKKTVEPTMPVVCWIAVACRIQPEYKNFHVQSKRYPNDINSMSNVKNCKL